MIVVISNHPLFKEFSNDEIAEIIEEFKHQKSTILKELKNNDGIVSQELRHVFHKSIGSLSYFLPKTITGEHRAILSAMDNHSFDAEHQETLKKFYAELEFSI